MISVLFVCIHNSARSQMAEAFLKQLGGSDFEVESAGLEPGNLNPLVVEVMNESGIDISKNESKEVSAFQKTGRSFDCVITVCDAASADRCPVIPGTHYRANWSFPDPSAFEGSHAEKVKQIRTVRDDIKKAVAGFVAECKEGKFPFA